MNEETELIKTLANKDKYTRAEKGIIKDLASKYSIDIPTCKCPNKWNDIIIKIYSKVFFKKEILNPDDEIIYIGVGKNINSKWGVIDGNLSRARILNIYENDYNTFKTFFKIIKK